MLAFRKRLLTRRNFIGACATGAGGLGYMRFGEAEWLEINSPQLALRNDDGAAEVRLLHLSDFHASGVVSLAYIKRAIDLSLELKPDLICLTGDFITARYRQFDEYQEILRALGEAAPTFACMGNHDGGSWVAPHGYGDWSRVGNMLAAVEITVLHNRSVTMEIRGRALQLVGLGDLWAREMIPAKAFQGAKSLPTILLSHNPDSKSHLGNYAWDLMLCGHTHGGQMRLPWIGTPFAPVRDKRYVEGLKPWQDRWIHVTKGVGNLHGVRLNCRPEISLLRVKV
jgi:predicted MPP superfamily phosphohydrolase